MDFHKVYGTAEYLDTGDGTKRHIGITSKGVLLYAYRLGGNITFRYSTSNGDTVSDLSTISGVLTHGGDMSFFIDELDGVHLVYAKYVAGGNDGRTIANPIIYRYGVLNAAHTGITWTGEVQIVGADYWHCPDVVAHKMPNGTNVKAHVFFNYNWSGDNRHILVYSRINIASPGTTGTPTIDYTGFILDNTGNQVYHGRISCELRHAGDGKRVQVVNGQPKPDIFFTATHGGAQHVGKMPWNATANSWDGAQVKNVIPGGGNVPSAPGTYMMGLYEHHRWARVLYDPVTSRVILVGWIATPSFSYQGLECHEAPADAITGTWNGWSAGNWSTNNALPAMISGTAALAPDGNLHLIGNTAWFGTCGWGVINRPRGSTARSYTFKEDVQYNQDGNGVHAMMLQYPQGEHHMIYRGPNNWSYYWRNNRAAAWVHDGSALNRRPTFLKRSDGNWVPVARQR